MLIVIASLRLPKVNGVKRAVAALADAFPDPQRRIRFETREAPSGVSDTPRSVPELMRGARHRADHAYVPVRHEPSLSVGVEGGVFREEDRVFLQSWTCVFDGTRYSFGGSGCIELPAALRADVADGGTDLGIAIDRFAQQADVRSRQGTFGVLTGDLVTREDSFAQSSLNALMPFFHTRVYGPSGT